jgi:hypothetical protein
VACYCPGVALCPCGWVLDGVLAAVVSTALHWILLVLSVALVALSCVLSGWLYWHGRLESTWRVVV